MEKSKTTEENPATLRPYAAHTDAPASPADSPRSGRVSNCYMFKSRLQEYAQKVRISTPVYDTMKEGPPHEPIFRSSVIVNDVQYDSLPGFFNRKAAEQSAAEVALRELGSVDQSSDYVPTVQESGLCKNILQEYSQKMNYAVPSYICKKGSRNNGFICTVEIGGIQYIGAETRNKKEAEIKAARTALLSIQSSEANRNGSSEYIVLPCKKSAAKEPEQPQESRKHCKRKNFRPKKKKDWKPGKKRACSFIESANGEGVVMGDGAAVEPVIDSQLAKESVCESLVVSCDKTLESRLANTDNLAVPVVEAASVDLQGGPRYM